MSANRIVASARSDPQLLRIYLNDHLAGAAGGVNLARRLAGAHKGTAAEPELADIARQVAEDRAALLDVMRQLDIPRTFYKETLATAAERVGRLKLNGSLLQRSPLSSVVELEGTMLGVTAKKAAWQSLRALADTDPRLDKGRLDALIERADTQLATLDRLRVRAVTEAMANNGQ